MSDSTPGVTAPAGASMMLDINFSGGMELLFDNKPDHKIEISRYYAPGSLASPAPEALPAAEQGKKVDIRFLIWWLREYLLEDKARPELFSQGESIRPGILVLVNSTDWELEGELDYELQDGDEITFISTLHGG